MDDFHARILTARKAIASTYSDSCSITGKQKTIDAHGATRFTDTVLYQDEPCRLSFSSNEAGSQSVTTAETPQTITLFLDPEVNVPPGSMISVCRGHLRYGDFEQSGMPAVYATHQEIRLVQVKKKA